MAVATHAARPLTIEDLADFPDDGLRREILAGELVVTPVPIPEHQLLVMRLLVLIANFAEPRRLGHVLPAPVDVRLSKYDIVEPDLVFIPADRDSLLSGKFIDGIPEIVIEVLSPSTKGRDLVRKRAMYATAGIPEYWIVDAESRSVLIYRLDAGMYQPVPSESGNPTSPVLTGLDIDLEKLFENIG